MTNLCLFACFPTAISPTATRQQQQGLATAVAWKTAKTGCSNNSSACRFNFKIKSYKKIYLYRLNVLSFSFMVVLNGKASEK
jgi:hypothetical protein